MSEALRSLADAARAMTAAASDDDVLAIVAQAARDAIGARHGIARPRRQRRAAPAAAGRGLHAARARRRRPGPATGASRRASERGGAVALVLAHGERPDLPILRRRSSAVAVLEPTRSTQRT